MEDDRGWGPFRGPNLYCPSPHCIGGSIPQRHSLVGPPAGYSSHLGPDSFPYSFSLHQLSFFTFSIFSSIYFCCVSPLPSSCIFYPFLPLLPPFPISYRFLVCPTCTSEAPFLPSSLWFSTEILYCPSHYHCSSHLISFLL